MSKSSRTDKANLANEQKRIKVQNRIFKHLNLHPNSTSYDIMTKLKISLSSIISSLDSLEKSGKVEKRLHIKMTTRGLRQKTTYRLVNTPKPVENYRIYINDSPEINWIKGIKIHLYIYDIRHITLTDKKILALDNEALVCLPLTLEQDEQKQLYVSVFTNLIAMYHLNDAENKVILNQTIITKPNTQVNISIQFVD